MKLKDISQIIKQTYTQFQEDKAPQMAAALSFSTTFSLAPLLIIVIAIAGWVFGDAAARGAVFSQTQSLMGAQGAQMIQTMIQNANKPLSGIIATIIGLITLLIGATSVFSLLQDELNTMWRVKPRPGLGIVAFFRQRILSFGLILVIGFFLLVSLVITSLISAAGVFLNGIFGEFQWLFQIVNSIVSLGIVAVLFALMFKYLPDAKIRWYCIWPGAIGTALLFTLGKFIIGIYLGSSAIISSYGAAGSLVVVLVWIYYTSQILFFGAEFTHTYAVWIDSKVTPSEYAVLDDEGSSHKKAA